MRIALRSRNRSPTKRRERHREVLVRPVASFPVRAVAALQILKERIVPGSRREICTQPEVGIRVRGTDAWVGRDVMPTAMRVAAQKKGVVVEAQAPSSDAELPTVLEIVGGDPLA